MASVIWLEGKGRFEDIFQGSCHAHKVAVCRVLDQSWQLSTLKLEGIPPVRALSDASLAEAGVAENDVPAGAALVKAEPLHARSGNVTVEMPLPPGYHLTEGANSSFKVCHAVI